MIRILLFLFVFFIGCGNNVVDDNSIIDDNYLDLIFVCDQMNDEVVIINQISGVIIETIYIDDDLVNYPEEVDHTPHFISIDETNEFWFVTCISSGLILQYSLETNSLIDFIEVGDSPALMVVDEPSQKLYVSRMMPMGNMGANSNIIQSILYNSLGFESNTIEYELESPAPHGIAITDDGANIFTTSNTADWLYKINTQTNTIEDIALEINTQPDFAIMRLKPIQCVYLPNNRLVVSCSAGSSYNSHTGITEKFLGQIQLWDTDSMTLLDTLQFDWKSSPWHIQRNSDGSQVYVALSGDNLYEGSAGVASIFVEGDSLVLTWQTQNNNFQGLHGVDVSQDDETIFVSGRNDGYLHVLDANSGNLLTSIPISPTMPKLGGVATVKTQ